jgi:hypothetical protein
MPKRFLITKLFIYFVTIALIFVSFPVFAKDITSNTGGSPLVINELAVQWTDTVNNKKIEWVELYNYTNEDIDLTGFYFKDLAGNQRNITIDNIKTELNPNQINTNIPLPPIAKANTFTILTFANGFLNDTAGNESLTLFSPEDVIYSELVLDPNSYPTLNQSYGYENNISGNLLIMEGETSTPGKSNILPNTGGDSFDLELTSYTSDRRSGYTFSGASIRYLNFVIKNSGVLAENVTLEINHPVEITNQLYEVLFPQLSNTITPNNNILTNISLASGENVSSTILIIIPDNYTQDFTVSLNVTSDTLPGDLNLNNNTINVNYTYINNNQTTPISIISPSPKTGLITPRTGAGY